MTTKERILSEALTLFSEKGYSDVFVGEIADAVGIKTPSLYKHFKGKQEIFDSCVEKFYERMTQIQNTMLLPGTQGASVTYQTASADVIASFAVGLFMFYWKDDVASKFRKILMIERYRNPELNAIFERLFVTGAVEHEEKIFSELMKLGIIKDEDPHIIALRFYTPIFYLLQKYDMHPEKESEAKMELTAMILEFCETYKGSNPYHEQV